MQLGILALTVACLTIGTGAEAETWFGPHLALPAPARDVGDNQLGLDAGVTLNEMASPHVGVGVNLAYHYWPASPGYKAAFDRYLRSARFEVIDGSAWAFNAFELTAHVKVLAPIIERQGPWVQAGAGLYRINRNLEERNWDDGIVIIPSRGSNISVVPGWNGSVGFDFRTGARTVLGLEANYHHLWSENIKDIPDFTAFTVGTHVLFRW